MLDEVGKLIDPPLVRVVFTAGFSNSYTGGVREFQVRARNMRGVIKQMDDLFPGLGEVLEEDTNVSVDGELHEVVYTQPVYPGSEIFVMPKLEAG